MPPQQSKAIGNNVEIQVKGPSFMKSVLFYLCLTVGSVGFWLGLLLLFLIEKGLVWTFYIWLITGISGSVGGVLLDLKLYGDKHAYFKTLKALQVVFLAFFVSAMWAINAHKLH